MPNIYDGKVLHQYPRQEVIHQCSNLKSTNIASLRSIITSKILFALKLNHNFVLKRYLNGLRVMSVLNYLRR